MFNESLSSEALPPTLRQAAITLIPKKGKDPLQCASYRPMSLLNGDYKILSKILAARLEKLVPQIISTDQTGFILNRHSSSNLRRLLNIVYSPSAPVPEMVISLLTPRRRSIELNGTTCFQCSSILDLVKLLYPG